MLLLLPGIRLTIERKLPRLFLNARGTPLEPLAERMESWEFAKGIPVSSAFMKMHCWESHVGITDVLGETSSAVNQFASARKALQIVMETGEMGAKPIRQHQLLTVENAERESEQTSAVPMGRLFVGRHSLSAMDGVFR